jgi:hypothetical protein
MSTERSGSARRRFHARLTPSLIERAPELDEAGRRLVEGGQGSIFLALRSTLDASRLPHRRDPGTAAPHPRQALGFVETTSYLVELSRFGECDGGRRPKADRAGLTAAGIRE